jgi:hypothetical protein
VSGDWIYSAVRLVMIAGTAALNRGVGGGAGGVQYALLHAFLADTLQGGGLAATKVVSRKVRRRSRADRQPGRYR